MKKRALLVGLKSVDPAAYGGWDGTGGCWGCELDVDNVERILQPFEYETMVLKTEAATHDAILEGLSAAAKDLEAGDIFVFYFSGHGGQQFDLNGDEVDGQDETLVAYDAEVVDDELNVIWPAFQPGVRIVMISDSCNSGTNYKKLKFDKEQSTPIVIRLDEKAAEAMQAQMIHFGGCRDGYTSSGYFGGGAFTMAMCNVLGNGFGGNYQELVEEIRPLVQDTQIAQYSEYGPVVDAFRNSAPFSPPSKVRCVLDIDLSGGDFDRVRAIIEEEGLGCILDAYGQCVEQAEGAKASGSVSCTAGSAGVSCTGTVTFNF